MLASPSSQAFAAGVVQLALASLKVNALQLGMFRSFYPRLDGCPRLNSAGPSSTNVAGGEIVDLTGTFLVTTGIDLLCSWTDGASTVTTEARYTAVSFGSTAQSVTCPAPSWIAALGDGFTGSVNLSLVTANGAFSVNHLTHSLYDCGTGTAITCDECHTDRPDECGWCLTGIDCTHEAGTNFYLHKVVILPTSPEKFVHYSQQSIHCSALLQEEKLSP